jgi:S-adenosylmethionine-diacylgycerolhomoserine-N-methlytransferase
VSSAINDTQQRMDRTYRHQRSIYDVTRRYYLLGRNHLVADLSVPPAGTVLEVGCGTASNLLQTARRYADARLCGFDISTEMLSQARLCLARRSLSERIILAIGDATAFDPSAMFGISKFDRIFTSFTLSMIPNWPAVLEEMARHLAPGGSIHVVDFGDCAGLPRIARTILYGWLDKFGVEPRQNMLEVLGKVAQRHGFQLRYTPLFRGYAQYGVLTRT